MSVRSVSALPTGAGVKWGSGLLDDGGYTYVYGQEVSGGLGYAHVARVPVGELDVPGAWRYWTGSAWYTDASSSTRVATGVSALYGVIHTGAIYTLVSRAGYPSRDVDESERVPDRPLARGGQRTCLETSVRPGRAWVEWGGHGGWRGVAALREPCDGAASA